MPARELAHISPKRIAAQAAALRALTTDRIGALVYLVRQEIEAANVLVRESYLRAVISELRAGDHKIQVIGDKTSSAAVIAAQQTVRRKH